MVADREIQSNVFDFENKILLNYVMGKFYCLVNDFDKAKAMLWKCVNSAKLSGKKNYHYLINAYLQLSEVNHHQGDIIKEGQMIANAKSCCSILPLSNVWIKEIYLKYGDYYLRQSRYEEALHHLEIIEKYSSNSSLLFVKYHCSI